MDSIGSVVARTITYVLIYTLARLIFSKVSIGGQLSHNTEEGIQINKKSISTIFLVVAIFCTALFSYFSTLPTNVEGTAKLIVRMIGIGFCLFCYMMSIAYSLWLIRLNNTEILYRNYLGKKSVIAFTNIDSFERKTNSNIIFYEKENKLIEIEAEHADSVLMWISARVRIINKQKNMSNFTVRPAKYQRVLSIITLIIFVVFLLLGIFVANVYAIVFFLCFTLFGVYICCSQYIEEYVIGNGQIKHKNFMRKDVSIHYTDVVKVEIKNDDNVSYYSVYLKSADKPTFKINTYYENAVFFKELAYKMKWIK